MSIHEDHLREAGAFEASKADRSRAWEKADHGEAWRCWLPAEAVVDLDEEENE